MRRSGYIIAAGIVAVILSFPLLALAKRGK